MRPKSETFRRRPAGRYATTMGTDRLGVVHHPADDDGAIDVINSAQASEVPRVGTMPLHGLEVADDRLGETRAGGARAEFYVSTKMGPRAVRDIISSCSPPGRRGAACRETVTQMTDLSTEGVEPCVEQSLNRLRLRCVGVCHLGEDGWGTGGSLDASPEGLRRSRAEGSAQHMGRCTAHADSATHARSEDAVDCLRLVGRWSQQDRSAEPDSELAAQAAGMVGALDAVRADRRPRTADRRRP